MTARGFNPRRFAVATARAQLAGSRLNVSAVTSAMTGVAPQSATTSAVAQKVKAGQITASPGPMPHAMSTRRSASVPLEVAIACRAPQNAASSLSSARTSGPWMNWQCASTRAIASSTAPPSRRRCAATSMNGIGRSSRRACRFMRISRLDPGSMDVRLTHYAPRSLALRRGRPAGAGIEATNGDFEACHALFSSDGGGRPLRMALTKASSSARNGSA
jgi:hypothetical protein